MSEQMLARPRRRRREVWTDLKVASLPRRSQRYFQPDPDLPGHGVRVYPSGARRYYVKVKNRWVPIGDTALVKLEDARESARPVIKRIKDGLEPRESKPPKPDSVEDVIRTWLTRHGSRLRSGDEVRRVLERHVIPAWGVQPFVEIGRGEIAKLLDAVEDKHGPWVADSVLSALRAVAGWYAGRHDSYQPPFVRGMRRVKAKNRKRERILRDDELRAFWHTAESARTFGALLRLLLLTAQRRDKVATMKWSDLSPKGVWTIATEQGEKGNPGSLQLPPMALEIIREQPCIAGNPHVLPASRGNGPLNGFNKRKAAFDRACGVSDWTLHDLRRTSRSLMSRAGVRPDISERVLGHAIAGVEGVYDRHHYDQEKADALAKLAQLIESVVKPTAGNALRRLD